MRLVVFLATLCVFIVACSATTDRKVLKFFFDGVPDPETAPASAQPAPTEMGLAPVTVPPPVPELSAAELAAGGYSAIDELKLLAVPKKTAESFQPSGAALEKSTTWEEAMQLLPVDGTGGVDWVEAVRLGLTVPQLVLGVNVEAPYTLDTLVAGAAVHPGSPFLDFNIEMTPEEKPFFKVSFPHSSHTIFLACSSCHPGVQEWDVEMDQILAGQACGQCHGRVSFSPETSCARCHESLVPPTEASFHQELTLAREAPRAAGPELLGRGKEVYQQYCAFCHGDSGDGAGRLAQWLTTKPRDFTAGTYKFRSTLGPLPTDLDLFGTITRGIPGTSMPAWSKLPSEDRWALVHYIKTFSDWFSEEEPGEPITIPEAPAVTAELLQQGQDLYKEAGCNSCHGEEGRGDGPSAPTLKDNWGEPVRPYNFASGRPMKSGTGPRNIFRIVSTGIGGTPMPAFGESLSPDQVWALAYFADSFRGKVPEPFAVRGDIHFERAGFVGPEGGGAGPSGDAVADSGEGGFWGDEEEAADDGGNGFWGDEEVAEASDGGESFWGDEEVEEAVEAADGGDGGDSFWGEDELEGEAQVAETETGGGDFWGDEAVAAEPSGGDDFWGEDEAGGASFANAPAHAVTGGLGGFAPALMPAEEPPLPPAIFPHWFHRARLKCANCHPQVFEMKAGANPINMDAMRAGLYCAKCHNGKIAFEVGFTTCPRCHQSAPQS